MDAQEVQSNLDLAISDRKKDMAVLEGKLQMEIEIMKKDIKQVSRDVCELKDTMDKFIASADKKYAKSWVEWAVKGAVASVLTAAIGLVVYLIQKHII